MYIHTVIINLYSEINMDITKPSITRFIIHALCVVIVVSHNMAYFTLRGKQGSSFKKKKRQSHSLSIQNMPLT